MARKTAAVAEAAGIFDVLPAGARPFAGRGGELAALTVAAGRPAQGRGRLLVLAGRPGSGRTALAVRWARSVAGDYPDGLLYARLSAPDGGRVGAGRAARMLLDQLGRAPARRCCRARRRRTRPARRCGSRSGSAGCWCCWTTSRTPGRCGRCWRRRPPRCCWRPLRGR
ncbi:ATP-binding protein [Kitasatospora saccharophila]|uniref:ATP-binding protein n=1 Tax=Kitasatospora saccharophila TaxID=407973 RepID=UPI00362E5C61